MFEIVVATFMGLWPLLDPAVAVHIEKLGDHRFMVRQKAHEELIKMSGRAVPQIQVAIHSTDPEVSKRAGQILNRYYAIGPTKFDKMPWIDSLPETYPNRQEIMFKYLAQARTALQRYQCPDWYEYRLATYLYLRESMENGTMTKKEAIKLIDDVLVPGDFQQLKRMNPAAAQELDEQLKKLQGK